MTREDISDLYIEHNRAVRRAVNSVLSRSYPADVDDVASDVWASMVAGQIADFRNECDVATWLYSIARNRAVSFLRARRAEPKMLQIVYSREREPCQIAEETIPAEQPADCAPSGASMADMQAAFDQLSMPDQRILRAAETLTTAQIAARFRIAPQTAYQRISRARKRLHASLERTCQNLP